MRHQRGLSLLNDESEFLKEELKVKENMIANQLEKVKRADANLTEASAKEEKAKKANLNLVELLQPILLKICLMVQSN